MPSYSVKWIVDGEMVVEAQSAADAERIAQERLVRTITNPDCWPEDLGARSMQGAAILNDGATSQS